LVHRRRDIATKHARHGKNDLDGSGRRRLSPVRNVLGAVMAAEIKEDGDVASLLGAVALLSDLPERGLLRGQVGAIVEKLDDAKVLVEFSDDQGRAYAIAPCPRDVLLVLRTMPRAA